MGENVDFHLPVEDKDEEEEASLPVLLPLLLPDFLTLEGEKKTNLKQSRKRILKNVSFYLFHFLQVCQIHLCSPKISWQFSFQFYIYKKKIQ